MLTHSPRVSVLSLVLALTALSAIRTAGAQEVSTFPSSAASSTTLAPLPAAAPSAEPAWACRSCTGLLARRVTVSNPVSISAIPTPGTVGPTIAAASIAVRHASTPASLAARRHGGMGQPEILMIVGGAALLVGLVIGGGAGDIIAIGGGVAALIGLYQYLQ